MSENFEMTSANCFIRGFSGTKSATMGPMVWEDYGMVTSKQNKHLVWIIILLLLLLLYFK